MGRHEGHGGGREWVAGASKGQEAPEGPAWWEALRNWVSEAISSPQGAALFLPPGCSGASPESAPRLWLKASRLGLSRRVGTPPRGPGRAGWGQGGQGGPARARSLGAARAVGRGRAGGHGAETELPLTHSSGPAELLPPWGGWPCLLEQGCRVAAAPAEQRKEQQALKKRRHLWPTFRAGGKHCGVC